MNFRRTKKDEPALELVPLIDVVLLLIIFFVTTTTFNRDSGITINLPKASVEQEKDKKPDAPIEVTIDKNGRYFVDHREVVNVQLETLKEAIRRTVGNRKNVMLIIGADAKTPHQSVVTAMDAARQLGIVRLSIATTETQ